MIPMIPIASAGLPCDVNNKKYYLPVSLIIIPFSSYHKH